MISTLMKKLFDASQIIIKAIAFIVFLSGAIFTLLGVYDFLHAFTFLVDENRSAVVGFIAVGLLRAVDLFLVAIVLFVFSLGLFVLFVVGDESTFPAKLPSWLKVSNFIQLKVLLWEAILTTLVVSYLAALAERRLGGGELVVQDLIIPGAIFLIAVSLFLLKRGESHNK